MEENAKEQFHDIPAEFNPDINPDARLLNDRFIITDQELGTGGYGKVRRGYDVKFNRPVAIKELQSEQDQKPEERERFLHEIKITANADSSVNTIPVYDAFIDVNDNNKAYMIMMEMPEESNLAERIASNEPLPKQAFEVFITQAAEAIDHYADENKGEIKILHNDIKPSNYFLVRDTLKNGRVVWHTYISDFGLSKEVDYKHDLKTDSVVEGSPRYMSPELLKNQKQDKRSSVYSLALVAYEAVTGEYLRQGELLDILKQHMFSRGLEEPQERKFRESLKEMKVDEKDQDRIVLAMNKALQAEPSERFDTAKEFSQAMFPSSN